MLSPAVPMLVDQILLLVLDTLCDYVTYFLEKDHAVFIFQDFRHKTIVVLLQFLALIPRRPFIYPPRLKLP